MIVELFYFATLLITELIHSPLLTNFPKAADLPDVMDGLRVRLFFSLRIAINL